MFVVVFILFGLSSCKNDQTERVNSEVAQQVVKFQKKYDQECRDKLFATAEKIVDSLLLEEAKAGVSDSLRNQVPTKPSLPVKLTPLDTENVAPLFPK